MLTSCDDPNTQKQIRRSEQIKKWNERENMINGMNPNNQGDLRQHSQLIMDQTKQQFLPRSTKVRFPKGCVFLAACSSGDTDEVKAHLKIGVNINTTNIDGLTALHQACIDANIEMVKFLVENNADINAQDNEGWTPLHAAVSVGNLEVTKCLINKGARLNMCNNDSDLPIDLCDTTNVQMKEFLDDEMQRQAIDADYERRKEELIMYEDARKMNFQDKVQSKTGATALHVSAAKGYTRVMKILLESGANPNALDKDGWTPLHAAAHWEQEDSCRILAENGAEFDIKTYSDQSVYDVCDTEMVNKLKQLETTAKQPVKLADVTSMNNQFKLPEGRRVADEVGKQTIARMTNEAKSSANEREKKHDNILLSPVSHVNQQKLTKFEYSNSENSSDTIASTNTKLSTDHDDSAPSNGLKPSATDDHLTFDKENRNSVHTPQSSNNGEQVSRQVYSKPNTKTGLHENLKSLSAQVRMMEDDSPALEQTPSTVYKRRLGATTSQPGDEPQAKAPLPPTTPPPVLSSPPQTGPTMILNNFKNVGPLHTTVSPLKVPGNSLEHIPGSPSQNTDNRRYSSVPVASKDEQAELIRKQKAKLERHFRRSTTAVSYEDIKSAEATIKGTGSNSNLNKVESNDSTNLPQVLKTSVTDQPVDLVQKTPTPAQLNTGTTSSTISGVSSLSTLFGEPARNQTSNGQNLTPTNHNSSISVNLASQATINLQVSSPTTTTSYMKLDSSPSLVNNQNLQQQSSNSNSSNENHIIANDIETDKLLNVIEKSKGFSDSKSTTARRLRNKPIVITTNVGNSHSMNNNNSGSNNDSQDLSGSAKLKVQNLRWNEEKLELEIVRKEREAEMLEKQNRDSMMMSPKNGRHQTSPTYVLKRQNSGPTLDSYNQSDAQPQTNNPSGRQTYRFGNNESNPYITSNGTNSLNRANIKRSVSQVPSSDRRAFSQAQSQSQSNSTPPFMQSPTSGGTSKSSPDQSDSKPIDYQAAYESEKKENESLKQIILKQNRDLEESQKEKRAYERRISELEEEVKKVDNLKQDNNRLKEENAALIRVISKLSK